MQSSDIRSKTMVIAVLRQRPCLELDCRGDDFIIIIVVVGVVTKLPLPYGLVSDVDVDVDVVVGIDLGTVVVTQDEHGVG